MHLGERYDWTGHNFPSEGWGVDSGSNVSWFRQINGKRYWFSACLNSKQEYATIVCMDAPELVENWRTVHHFVL